MKVQPVPQWGTSVDGAYDEFLLQPHSHMFSSTVQTMVQSNLVCTTDHSLTRTTCMGTPMMSARRLRASAWMCPGSVPKVVFSGNGLRYGEYSRLREEELFRARHMRGTYTICGQARMSMKADSL
eukprot:365053-Chlamydomonas_euryale.AAC.8